MIEKELCDNPACPKWKDSVELIAVGVDLGKSENTS